MHSFYSLHVTYATAFTLLKCIYFVEKTTPSHCIASTLFLLLSLSALSPSLFIPACKFSKTNAACISLCYLREGKKVLSMNDGNCWSPLYVCAFHDNSVPFTSGQVEAQCSCMHSRINRRERKVTEELEREKKKAINSFSKERKRMKLMNYKLNCDRSCLSLPFDM